MMINVSTLASMGFVATHQITQQQEPLRFTPLVSKGELARFNQTQCVYLWASVEKDDQVDIIYVGKAGGGIGIRLQQHQGGFRNSPTGIKNSEALMQVLANGKNVTVFSRAASKVTLFDVEVSSYSSEEEALIERLSPWLNRARMVSGKPTGNKLKNDPQQREGMATNNHIAGLEDLNHAEEIHHFADSLSPDERSLFNELLQWSLSLNETRHLEQKIVKGYTNQAGEFNGMPILLFAELGESGRALNNTWRIRLPLGRLGIVLPLSKKSNHIDNALIDINDKSQSFSPKDIADFIRQPSKYTKMH